MKAILENGMLYITPKDKEEEKELNKWYNKTYESYDEMDDFMIYIEPVKNNVGLGGVSACLPKLPDLQHKHDLNNSSGWSSHPDDCYLEGVEETYKAIKKELSNKH
jgi:hypothetical protein